MKPPQIDLADVERTVQAYASWHTSVIDNDTMHALLAAVRAADAYEEGIAGRLSWCTSAQDRSRLHAALVATLKPFRAQGEA